MNIGKQYAYVDRNAPTGKDFKRFEVPIIGDKHLQATRKMFPHSDEYLSVYIWRKWFGGPITTEISKSAVINRIFFDFDDGDNPENAFRDAGVLASHIGSEHCLMNYSGAKGAHITVLCDVADLIPDMKSAVLRGFAKTITDEIYNLPTMDWSVIGDTSRVRRIVNSMHSKTGDYAIPLALDELETLSLAEVSRLAYTPRDMQQTASPAKWVTDTLYQIEQSILETRIERLNRRNCISKRLVDELIDLLPSDRLSVYKTVSVIEYAWRQAVEKSAPKTGGALIGSSGKETWLLQAEDRFKRTGRAAHGDRRSEHKERVHLVKLAVECGWNERDICNIFTGADDYDPTITERMVQSCIGRR